MAFSIYDLFLIASCYLLALFSIAWATEKGFISQAFTRHPFTYTLSIGAFAGAWVLFGAIGLADQLGFGFLSYFFGASCMFLFSPLLLQPMLQICRTHQLSSLADVLSFRYNSKWAGAITTLLLVIASMPLISLQIEAIINTTAFMSGTEEHKNSIGILFWATLILFTFIFGSKNIGAKEQHHGLVAAIAFESLLKLVAFLLIGFFCWKFFHDLDGINSWLYQNPELANNINEKLKDSSIHLMLLIFFSSVIVLPHSFHMLFAEHPSNNALRAASWGMPLYLFLLSLPILPILWAGKALDIQAPADYFPLFIGYALSKPWLTVLAYIAGLSAASGAIVILVLSLSSMALNYLVLPLFEFAQFKKLHYWLVRAKQFFIVILITLGYLFHSTISDHATLTNFTFMAFVLSLQFMPGIIACFYWPQANKKAFITGLISGFLFLIIGLAQTSSSQLTNDYWNWLCLGSLAVNLMIFIFVSLKTQQSEDDKIAAEICSPTDIPRTLLLRLSAKSIDDMTARLTLLFDEKTAKEEIKKVMRELDISPDDNRPLTLSKIRQQLLANFSGLLGPSNAQQVIDQVLPLKQDVRFQNEDLNKLEQELEPIRKHFTGLVAELDKLRHHHQEIVRQLPIGAFSLSNENEILMWNKNMEVLTDIASENVIGAHLEILSSPWQSLFLAFVSQPEFHTRKQELLIKGKRHWFSLHKSVVEFSPGQIEKIIMVEDLTETSLLEQELIHHERLASIGRLAAGVAHEIGNPVTGIACLAQNLNDEDDFAEVKIAASQITQQTKRISKILQSLMRFAYQSGGNTEHDNFQTIDVKKCIDDAIALLELDRDACEVHFINNTPENLTCYADGQQLQQVFINLLSNARDASEKNGAVEINATTKNNIITLSVTDQGHGISEQDLGNIFEPFFTTKEPGSGTGLGLSLVYRIIEQHGGQISAESPVANLRGTRFKIKLPQNP